MWEMWLNLPPIPTSDSQCTLTNFWSTPSWTKVFSHKYLPKSSGPYSVVGHVPTLPWFRSSVWVRVGLGLGQASGKGWVGTWPVNRLDLKVTWWLLCLPSCPTWFVLLTIYIRLKKTFEQVWLPQHLDITDKCVPPVSPMRLLPGSPMHLSRHHVLRKDIRSARMSSSMEQTKQNMYC